MNKTQSPTWRFCIALGAASGIGHVLFRALTANLGPILGLALSTVAIGGVVLGIFLLLEHAAKGSAERQTEKS